MKKIPIVLAISVLLIASSFLATAIRHQDEAEPLDIKDQFQENEDECKWFDLFAWQEFQPRGKKHLRIEVKIKQGYESSPPLKLTLEQPLGNVLSGIDIPATSIPNVCDWVTFDIPDVEVDIDKTAFINLSYAPGGEYAWAGAYSDPYPQGTSSEGSQWDWCFRTFVDKAKPYENSESIEFYQPTQIRILSGFLPAHFINLVIWLLELI